MSITVTDLVSKIEQKRQQSQLNESAFAKRLGVSRANWFLIKKQERKPGLKFLQAVLRVFPDLQLDIANYMAQGGGVQ